MQAIALPFTVDDAGHEILVGLRRVQSAAVRTAYANATGRTEKELLELVKARFGVGNDGPGAVDAWLLSSATREGIKLHNQHPNGRMVFGGRKNLERRQKGLIEASELRAMRLRPLISMGDKDRLGNRHFHLSQDSRTCTVKVYGRPVTLHLPEMRGKRAKLLRAVSMLAAAGEINVEFRLGDKSLSVVFDPQDLRRLPAGVTLQADDDAKLAAKGHKARGRPRGVGYKPPPFRWADFERPVHPEWGPALTALPGRSLGIDLNPDWIGLTVVENLGDIRSLASTRIVDHRLIKLDMAVGTAPEVVTEMLAKVANTVMRLCEAQCVGLVTMESGLGKLRSAGRGKKQNRLLNGWDRTRLSIMLARRLGLRGGTLVSVWAGYSTTIGNIAFPLPDACAAAAEIARRGLGEMDWRARTRAARLNGSLPKGGVSKDLLPFHGPEVLPSLWKDSAMPMADVPARLRQAGTWQVVHREMKAAKIGYRRPHPDIPSGAERHAPVVPGFAVSRLGHRRRPGLTLRVLPAKRPDQPGRAAVTRTREAGKSPRRSR